MNTTAKNDITRAEAARLKSIYLANKKRLGITQERIALEGLGASSSSAVSHYMNGKIPLNARAASVFAKYLQCSVSDFSPRLASEIASLSANPKDSTAWSTDPSRLTREQFAYPIKGEIQGSKFREVEQQPLTLWPTSNVDAGNRGFWVKIDSDSTIADDGRGVTPGSLLLVNPDQLNPTPGRLYLFSFPDEEYALRFLTRDAGDFYLKPISSSYKTIPLSLGVTAIGAIVDLKSPLPSM